MEGFSTRVTTTGTPLVPLMQEEEPRRLSSDSAKRVAVTGCQKPSAQPIMRTRRTSKVSNLEVIERKVTLPNLVSYLSNPDNLSLQSFPMTH